MGHNGQSPGSTEAGSRPPGESVALLRVGILLDSMVQPAWARKIIADIQASSFSRVALVVRQRGRESPRRGLFSRILHGWRHALHDLYVRADDRIFRGEPDAFAMADAIELLRSCPVVEAGPEPSPEDLALLRSHDLDVAVSLAGDPRTGAYAAIARHGVWSLHHAPSSQDGVLPGLWEVMAGDQTTISLLRLRSGESAVPRVIYRSHGATDHISVRRNRNPHYWKTSAFVLRKLRDLALEGPLALEDEGAPAPEAPPLRTRPTNLVMAGLLVRLAVRYLRRKVVDLLSREQWYLAYRFERTAEGEDGFHGLRVAMPPRDRYWADPFPVRADDGRTFLFFEELRYSDPKGRIMAMEVDPEKGALEPFPVLERGYHLSYPQVFRWQGQYYMLPESSENRTVTLFRCVSFPDRWVEERDLLRDVDAVDATVAEIDGSWWMFVNISPFGAGNRDELHLYHAPSPLGPWTPHPRNPVKSDCRGARPAGRPYRRGGRLYRPAQNCADAYGSSIVIHRIDQLTPEAFRETTVGEIVPSFDPRAERTHTINRCEGLLVLDLLRRRRRRA